MCFFWLWVSQSGVLRSKAVGPSLSVLPQAFPVCPPFS